MLIRVTREKSQFNAKNVSAQGVIVEWLDEFYREAV